MSHVAVAWAHGVKGLRPAAKLVLLTLADCHNPAFGCFPSQAYIADACEISLSTVNRHLATLEAAGLILRHASVNAKTMRQMPTVYILGFEIDHDKVRRLAVSGRVPRNTRRRKSAPEAVPKTGPKDTDSVCQNDKEPYVKNDKSRMSKWHTNLVKEPVKEPVTARASKSDLEVIAWVRGERPCTDARLCLDDLIGLEIRGLITPREVMQAQARLPRPPASRRART